MPSTPDLRIAQGIVLADRRGVRVAAQSDGFDAAEAERVVVLFGERPAGVTCPLAHFACPFGRGHVAVVQVADRPGPESPLGFRFLVLGHDLYRHLGDPFAVADRFRPPWDGIGSLPVLEWPPGSLPPRTVQKVDAVLRHGDGPLLLGSAQALVDGSRVVVKRDAPDETYFRGLWQLLPDRSRRDLWPASFCFALDLGFHAAAMPAVPPLDRVRFHDEEQVRDYPQGKYELGVQAAAEHGDQKWLDELLARRTSDETLRLGLYIIAAALVLAVLFKFVIP
jgi:hypothetical protein